MHKTKEESKNLVDIKKHVKNPFIRLILNIFGKQIEKFLGIEKINYLYKNIDINNNEVNYFSVFLKALNINYSISQNDIEKLPEKGPVIIVANHPFGGIEGIIVGDLLLKIRPDIKFLANYLLQNVKELENYIIPIDPYKNKISFNSQKYKEAIRFIKNGGLLITFPSGEVSHINIIARKVIDSSWNNHIARLIRHTKATVIPVYFPGRNSFIFQLLGLIHPVLRTFLLPHELINKSSKNFNVFIGNPIPWNKTKDFDNDNNLINYLRTKTYFLKNRIHIDHVKTINTDIQKNQDIISPIETSLLLDDLKYLQDHQKLIDTSEYSVYITPSGNIPNILVEIGRLREITFREVNEGTGNTLDLDDFDKYYLHLILWNKKHQELVGSYRIGITDELIEKYGLKGLYTNTLFHFKDKLIDNLHNSLELGRSFIRRKYQRQYNCLYLLWQGIAEFIIRNPKYHILFGAVSISKDYNIISRYFIVEFLRHISYNKILSKHVNPRNPFKLKDKIKFQLFFPYRYIKNTEDISTFISEIENDGKGIPILLKQYLRLNARLLGFQIDNISLGGLIMVNLLETNKTILKKFMGNIGFDIFSKFHQL